MSAIDRRRVLCGALRLLAGAVAMSLPGAGDASRSAPGTAAPNEGTPSVPDITFLPPEAAAAAMAADRYYDGMDVLDIRARVTAPLPPMGMADARIAVYSWDAAAVLPFSDDECTAVRGVIERMQALLAVRAPLYARTPWSFIKLDDRAEGGLPHTRGPHIVLPRSTVEAYARRHKEMGRDGTLATSPRGRSLLLHEQTHVLERANPAIFELLITDVFGFTRMTSAPATPWLAAHTVANPDGPDAAWAFDLAQVGGTGSITPRLVFADVPMPRIPEDFQTVGIDVVRTWNGWKIVEENGLPRRRDLDKIPGFDAHFPFPGQDFHPNEIAAEVLPHWILQDRPGIEQLPLMPAVAEWASWALAVEPNGSGDNVSVATNNDNSHSRRHVCNVADWF